MYQTAPLINTYKNIFRVILALRIVTIKDNFMYRILKHSGSTLHIYTNEPVVPKKVPGPRHSIEKIKVIIIFQDVLFIL